MRFEMNVDLDFTIALESSASESSGLILDCESSKSICTAETA